MDISMSMEEVMDQIKRMVASGEPQNKKRVKQVNPDLMQGALYYFPSWDHAVQRSLD
ncbi:hypothetical protein [Lihuaxuella thermophila]|uniref:Uncharacterized protein n=1 Tax=Lihuaxuella thermophila TaxID=1173111 RepID=A0A1H8F8I4_9BACL|nr:hypothetical protein [Lihuaxuella thermophila]SEN28039.1 hypothetical protein SAMN05444955_10867 [Lihuaxuella thermophila]